MNGTRPVLVIGAGGHAKVCIEVLRSEGRFHVIGCVDPYARGKALLGVPVFPDDETIARFFAEGVRHAFIALGGNSLRARLGSEILDIGYQLVNAISPRATISPTAHLGHGILVMPGAAINAEAVIDDLAIVNTNAVVEHDCRLGAACHVAPGSVLAGGVAIGARAFVGASATLIPGISVGADSIVGAGAAVVRDVPPGETVVGVPARAIRKDKR